MMTPSNESHLDLYRRWHRLSKPYIRWQFEQFVPFIRRRVADVGCGLGNFTELLLDRDLYLGVDLDEELLQELEKNNRPSPVVHTALLDLTGLLFKETLRKHAVDTILCVNVIEHIEKDRLAVSHMIEPLPSGGYLCLLVPALPFLFGSLDALDGHYRRYTKPSLSKLFAEQPGRLEHLYYFNLAGVPGWFLKGRILKQKTHTDDNYHLMNTILPVLKPIERCIHPPFGMSLVAIFRKE